MGIYKLYGRLIISGDMIIKTGLHIGDSSEFAPIGAVDSTIVRDPVSMEPYIPGSSIKGKMRYLMARCMSDTPILERHDKENTKIKRLFGSSGDEIVFSRLQFEDIRLSERSKKIMQTRNQDYYLSEVKFENTINRVTGIANPRQIERIPAGTEFEFRLSYLIENLDELDEDFDNVKTLFELLEDDYLGGSGTRGYGRIKFSKMKAELKQYDTNQKIDMTKYSI